MRITDIATAPAFDDDTLNLASLHQHTSERLAKTEQLPKIFNVTPFCCGLSIPGRFAALLVGLLADSRCIDFFIP